MAGAGVSKRKEGGELLVISDWLLGRESSGFFEGERRRPAGCVTHLAGHLFKWLEHFAPSMPGHAWTFHV